MESGRHRFAFRLAGVSVLDMRSPQLMCSDLGCILGHSLLIGYGGGLQGYKESSVASGRSDSTYTGKEGQGRGNRVAAGQCGNCYLHLANLSAVTCNCCLCHYHLPTSPTLSPIY